MKQDVLHQAFIFVLVSWNDATGTSHQDNKLIEIINRANRSLQNLPFNKTDGFRWPTISYR